MEQQQLDLIYAYLGIWTDGGGPWSAISQEPSEPYIEKAIPKMWAIAAHVDDDRGVEDELAEMFSEEMWNSLGDETRGIFYDRATESWLAFLVSKATVQLMGGPIIMETTTEAHNAKLEAYEASCFQLRENYIRTGMVVR